MDAAVAALLGALTGVLGSFGTTWLQQKAQTSRDRQRLATDLGIADHKAALDLAKSNKGRSAIPPLSAFVAYHADVLEHLHAGSYDVPAIRKLEAKHTVLMAALADAPDPSSK